MTRRCFVGFALVLGIAPAVGASRDKGGAESPIDLYIRQAEARQAADSGALQGSLFEPDSLFVDLLRDFRARRVGDLVTIVVLDRASALSKGTVSSSRKSNARASIPKLLGPVRAAGPLSDLLSAGSAASLEGEGSTSRENNLALTLSAVVTHVLPNGQLILEGTKDVTINTERQTVVVRAVARPVDVSAGGQIRSDRLAHLEIRIGGRGVVGDAVRRPWILYRILLGLLPF